MNINWSLFLIILLISTGWFIVGYMYGKFTEKTKRFKGNEKCTIFRKNQKFH